jgi:hypothetical protein
VTLIEAAQRLISDAPTYATHVWQGEAETCPYCLCANCQGSIRYRIHQFSHDSECPTRTLPRIVAALEAAERVSDKIGSYCDFCTGSPDSGHFDGCPIQALVAALRGDDLTVKTADGQIVEYRGVPVEMRVQGSSGSVLGFEEPEA